MDYANLVTPPRIIKYFLAFSCIILFATLNRLWNTFKPSVCPISYNLHIKMCMLCASINTPFAQQPISHQNLGVLGKTLQFGTDRESVNKKNKGMVFHHSLIVLSISRLLIKCSSNVNRASNCTTYHWVVTDSEESH